MTAQRGKTGLFIFCFAATALGGVSSSLMSVYLPSATRDFHVPDGQLDWVKACVNAAFIFGWVFGGISWGRVCDKIGRAPGVWLSTLFFGAWTVLTAVAPNWQLVTLFRFLSGFGVGGVLVATTIHVSEAWSGRARTVALGILSIAFPVGIFSAGLTNYLVAGWKQAFLLGIVPVIIALLSWLWLPESDQWKEGRAVARTSRQGEGKNLILGSVIFGSMLIGLWAVFSWLPEWTQALPGMDSRAAGISIMVMGAGGLAGGFFSGWIAHALGLKKSMLICFSVCFILTLTLFRTNNSLTALAYAELAVLAFFFGMSQGVLSAYVPGLFAVSARAASTGFCFNSGRLFTAAAVFFVGVLARDLGGFGNSICIFSIVFVIGLVATWRS